MWAKHDQRIKEYGFTIVELLIVVVVIGILAAIVTVAYTGISSSARDAAVENDLANLGKKLEIYKATNSYYPANSTELDAADMKVSQGSYMLNRNNLYYCRSDDLTEYAIGAQSISGSNYFLINGTVAASGGVSGAATCSQISTPNTWASTGVGTTNVWAAWTQ